MQIKIDHTVSGGSAIHVIQRNPKPSAKKDLDEKSQKADQKRLQSLNKMKDSYAQQKNAIKQALASVDVAKKSNKIVFSDAEDNNDTATSVTPQNTIKLQTRAKEPNKKKLALFEDDDKDNNPADYSKDFAIKEQFQGAKGERLMRLQSRFQNDKRFNMDARFLDDGDHGNNEGEEIEAEWQNGQHNEAPEDDERQWQYNILESVMGKKMNQGPPAPTTDSKKK